jgi:hypothetical protein
VASLTGASSNAKSPMLLVSGSFAMANLYLIERAWSSPLGGEQIADDALRLMLTLDHGGDDPVKRRGTW